jgi:uncharacterized membrane protein (UPF0127 family)
MGRWFGVLTFAVCLFLPPSPWGGGSILAAERQPLQIATKNGVRRFQVELANTEAQISRGLMFRKRLPADRGMLFDLGSEQEITMWMKNTYVPLDMLFIRADGRIHRIAENTKRLSTDPIPSEGPVLAVLEVVAGTARKLGIAPGDRVSHPIFRRP